MGDVAIPGMIGPGDFTADQRPKDWTQGMLDIDPNGDVILTYLLSILPKVKTVDNDFNWHDRYRPSLTAAATGIFTDALLSAAYTATDAAVGRVLYIKLAEADAKMFRGGDQLLLRKDLDASVDKNSLVLNRVINGASSYVAVKLLEADEVNHSISLKHMDIVAGAGTAQGVGSPMPDSVTYAPEKYNNRTQIFEESLDLSRTGLKTHLRTGDIYMDAKTLALQTLLQKKERAYFFGSRYEDTDDKGKERTFTGGIRWFLREHVPENIFNFAFDTDYAGVTWKVGGEDWLDNAMEQLFRYGSDTKFGISGPGCLLGLKAIAKQNSSYEITSKTTSYGLNVYEFVSPFGRILFKKHPDFIYDNVMRHTTFVLDTKYMHDRVMDSITFKPDPNKGKGGNNSIDGVKESFLGETGLMLRNLKAFGMLQGFGVDNGLTP